jgi:histone H3/H4
MADLLVVASKIKKYIKEKAQMSTSASSLGALSDIVKSACDNAIAKAQSDGRKTVMDRDVSSGSSAPSAETTEGL